MKRSEMVSILTKYISINRNRMYPDRVIAEIILNAVEDEGMPPPEYIYKNERWEKPGGLTFTTFKLNKWEPEND